MDELVQAQSLWFPMCSGQQLKDELYLSLSHHTSFTKFSSVTTNLQPIE